ncbi:MAG: capsule biosynthesis protein [Paracoccus denitrificans]|nr:MAG: capsule biosynthesis protein [Paracoccus denitrificans]PZO83829.1 MAG: capsule biosynthesis protein [Paracoccus denitrificans]
MTTPPKARLYRISRAESPLSDRVSGDQATQGAQIQIRRVGRGATTPSDDMPFAGGANEDGFGDLQMKKDASAAKQPDAPPAGSNTPATEAELAAVEQENLTVRQLRLAGRIAAMHHLTVASDADAVVQLRKRQIDPFNREALTKLISAEGSNARKAPSPTAPIRVPTKKEVVKAPGREVGHPRKPDLPSREEMTEERRAAEIMAIQRDIARRRRRSLSFLLMRLMLLIGIPTLLIGWYYFNVASPLYETESQFSIQMADGSGLAPSAGVGGLSALQANSDSVKVQGYLTSRDAMLRLDKDLGFKRTYQSADLDPLIRLPADATNEQTYGRYKKSVKIAYDPTDGVINMSVIAPDPQLSREYALALIRYAEGEVDQQSARMRNDQMKGASDNYADAEKKVQDAQRRLQDLQLQLGVLNPEAESTMVLNRVSQLENELTSKQLELGQLQSNPNPNPSRVRGVQGDIERLQQMISDTRQQLTQNAENRDSLAQVMGEIRLAESDLTTRQTLLSMAAEQMENARIEANKQVRYMSVSVAPIPPDQPTYPKALEGTFVAFLILSGIYLMLSLTFSILREQVSS